MAFRVDDYQKQAHFPEEGTPEFMVVMGRSLKAYDAALDLLIEVMELLRDSLMEMVEIHYGLNAYGKQKIHDRRADGRDARTEEDRQLLARSQKAV